MSPRPPKLWSSGSLLASSHHSWPTASRECSFIRTTPRLEFCMIKVLVLAWTMHHPHTALLFHFHDPQPRSAICIYPAENQVRALQGQLWPWRLVRFYGGSWDPWRWWLPLLLFGCPCMCSITWRTGTRRPIQLHSNLIFLNISLPWPP